MSVHVLHDLGHCSRTLQSPLDAEHGCFAIRFNKETALGQSQRPPHELLRKFVEASSLHAPVSPVPVPDDVCSVGGVDAGGGVGVAPPVPSVPSVPLLPPPVPDTHTPPQPSDAPALLPAHEHDATRNIFE